MAEPISAQEVVRRGVERVTGKPFFDPRRLEESFARREAFGRTSFVPSGRVSAGAAGFVGEPAAVAIQRAEAATEAKRVAAAKAEAVSEVSKVDVAAGNLKVEADRLGGEAARIEVQRAEVERLSASQVAPAPFVRTQVARFNQRSEAFNAKVRAFNERIGVVEQQAVSVGERASLAGIEGPREITISEAGGIPAITIERPTFEPTRTTDIPATTLVERLPSKRAQAIGIRQHEMAAALGFGLSLPIGAAGAFGIGGAVGLARFGVEVGGGLVGAAVLPEAAEPFLRTIAAPGRTEADIQLAKSVLSVPGFIVGAKGAGLGFDISLGVARGIAKGLAVPKMRIVADVLPGGGVKVVTLKELSPGVFGLPTEAAAVPITVPAITLKAGVPALSKAQASFFKSISLSTGVVATRRPFDPAKILAAKEVKLAAIEAAHVTRAAERKFVDFAKLPTFQDPVLLRKTAKLLAIEELQAVRAAERMPIDFAKLPTFAEPLVLRKLAKQLGVSAAQAEAMVGRPPFKPAPVKPPTLKELQKEAFGLAMVEAEAKAREVFEIQLARTVTVFKPVARAKPFEVGRFDVPGAYAQLARGLPRVRFARAVVPSRAIAFGRFAEFARTPTPFALPAVSAVERELAKTVPREERRFGEFLGLGISPRLAAAMGVKPAMTSKVIQRSLEREREKEEERIATLFRTGFGVTPAVREAALTGVAEIPAVRPAVRVATGVQQLFREAERLREKELLRLKPKFGFPLPPFQPLWRKRMKRAVRKRAPGFDALVKVRGSFQRVNRRPLHKNTALGLGAFVTDWGSPQTFKVREAKQPATGSKKARPNLRKFRKPVRKGVSQAGSPLWIERTPFLIDKPGERKEITGAGLQALRGRFFAKPKRKKRKRSRK